MRADQRGYSLVEAVVTLCLLAGLGAAAATSLGELVHGARLRAYTAGLQQHLLLARSEAIKRNTRVAACKSQDGATCARAGGWEQGWILFQDRNNSGAREAHEPVLQRMAPLPAGWRLTGNSPVSRYVSYSPFGVAMLTSGAFQAGTFTACRASVEPVEASQIVINAGGRPRVQKTRLASCP